MDNPERRPPRSAEELVEAIQKAKEALKDGYQLSEPDFVLTKGELLFLYQRDQGLQDELKKARAYAEKVDSLLLERNAELAQERQLREAYQAASEAGVKTINGFKGDQEEIQKQLEANKELIDSLRAANKEWAGKHAHLQDSFEKAEKEREEVWNELIRLTPAEGAGGDQY